MASASTEMYMGGQALVRRWCDLNYLINLILEALEDEFSLFILVFSNSILRAEFVEFHRLRSFKSGVLGVEHMSTQIHNSLLVDLQSLIVCSPDLRVVLHKFIYSVHEVASVNLALEVVLGKIAQSDEDVHQNRHWNLFLDQS